MSLAREVMTLLLAGENVMMQLATGGGKTEVFLKIASVWALKRGDVHIVTHKEELARQPVERAREYGIPIALAWQKSGSKYLPSCSHSR